MNTMRFAAEVLLHAQREQTRTDLIALAIRKGALPATQAHTMAPPSESARLKRAFFAKAAKRHPAANDSSFHLEKA